MDATLFQETIHLLQNEVEGETHIRLDIDEQAVQDMVLLLHSYRIERTRKITILGCYLLLHLAVGKHRELKYEDGATAITTHILDGDYFFGLYFRWLVKCREIELFQLLAPIHKKLQIGILNGHYPDQLFPEVVERIRKFLSQPYSTAGR